MEELRRLSSLQAVLILQLKLSIDQFLSQTHKLVHTRVFFSSTLDFLEVRAGLISHFIFFFGSEQAHKSNLENVMPSVGFV